MLFNSDKRIFIFLTLIIVILLWLIFFPPVWQQEKKVTTQQGNEVRFATPPLPQYTSQQSVTVPIALSDRAVKLAGVTYTLSGTVRSITKIPDKSEWRILFQSPGGNVFYDLPFSLSEETAIYDYKDSSKKIKITELEYGDRIEVSYYYNLLKKEGAVTFLRLIR